MTFDEAAARSWLLGPDPDAPEYTVAESLEIGDDFCPETAPFWPYMLDSLVSKAIDVTSPDLLPHGTLLWLVCDNEGQLDGTLITRECRDLGIRLCSAYLDLNDLVDDTQAGIDCAVGILRAVHDLAAELAVPDSSADDEADDEADDTVVTCTNCHVELPTDQRCEESDDGEHVPDMYIHEPPADDPTRDIRLDLVVTVPNDGYDYCVDKGGRLERVAGRLLNDRLVTTVETRGRSGSGYAGEAAGDDLP